jgi:hypothetical protein
MVLALGSERYMKSGKAKEKLFLKNGRAVRKLLKESGSEWFLSIPV